MKKELRWRVIYGYGISDYISIGESMLEKAKYAMMSGKIFSHGGKMRRGSEIKGIEPDYRFYTGWSDSYKFGNAEDMSQIERDCPLKEIQARSEKADLFVRGIIEGRKDNQLQINGTEK